MFQSLPLPVLVCIFLLAAGAIWVAGIKLSDMTDILSLRWGFGEALGGMVLLAIVTNLPEIAITVSAALSGNIDVAVGNILGGIAIQTVVLVIFDVFGLPPNVTLTKKAANLTLAIEGLVVVAVLVAAIMATQLPSSLFYQGIAPGSILIVILWLTGLSLVWRANKGLPWHDRSGNAPDAQEKPKGHSRKTGKGGPDGKKISTIRASVIFAIAAIITLISGILLERVGHEIASAIGMTGILFGATVLAAATALPEVSTGLTSMKLRDYQLAVSDIFGGNAFLPVLFLLATVLSGQAVLPRAHDTDIYLASLGVLLTCCYIAGLIFRPTPRVLRMGIDSLAVLVLYAVGMAGLFAIAFNGA